MTTSVCAVVFTCRCRQPRSCSVHSQSCCSISSSCRIRCTWAESQRRTPGAASAVTCEVAGPVVETQLGERLDELWRCARCGLSLPEEKKYLFVLSMESPERAETKKNSLSRVMGPPKVSADLMMKLRLSSVLDVTHGLAHRKGQGRAALMVRPARAATEVVASLTDGKCCRRTCVTALMTPPRAPAILSRKATSSSLALPECIRMMVFCRDDPLMMLVVSTPSTVKTFSAPLAPLT